MDKRMKSSEVSGHAHAYRALDNRGMTLVEVIISILILSILLIAILSMTDVSIRGVFAAGEQNKATAKVAEKSDQVYALIINAEDASKAEQALDAEEGCVAGKEYLNQGSRDAQFYYSRSTYLANGVPSVGFDVVVVCYYGKDTSPNKVELTTFVLKTSDGE